MTEQHHKSVALATKGKNHTRSLKVRKGCYSRSIKDKDHSCFDRTVHSTVPWINIQGQWLEQAGFSIDTPIKVRVMDGCLVLTAET